MQGSVTGRELKPGDTVEVCIKSNPDGYAVKLCIRRILRFEKCGCYIYGYRIYRELIQFLYMIVFNFT